MDTISITATGTIVLGGMLPLVTDHLTINGPGELLLTISGNNSVRVMRVNAGIIANLSNVTIANGNVSGAVGGGIYNLGMLAINNTTILSNTAEFDGGGIYNEGTLTITNSTLRKNVPGTDFSGGGVYNYGTLTITNSSIYSNTAGYNGGGIYSYGVLTITNSFIYSNTAGNNGGGIYSYGMLNIADSTIRNNYSSFNGGGVALYVTGIINNSTVQENTTSNPSSSAGGIFNAGTLTITNSTVNGNTSVSGGGIRNSGTMTITNSTIHNNTASNDAGGILNYWILTVTNSTLAGNGSPGTAGIAGDGTTTMLRNTIVANNPASRNCSGTITNGGNNIDSGTTCGWSSAIGSLSGTDPKLAPLGSYGGSTKTMALFPGSPAIDGVIYNAPNGCPATDQRGVLRPIGTRCDIGAFEAPLFYFLPLIFR